MKKKLATFLFWFYFLGVFFAPFLASCSYNFEDMQINPFDYARITDVEYKAVVVDEPDSEGKVIITERLTFDIHAASKNNLFWELWRDLPEDYIDGVKVDYKVHSVKQILDDGTEIIYEESPKLYWDDYDYVSSNPTYGPGKWYHSEGPYNEEYDRYECVFFYVDGLYREQVVFEIEYEMHNAALRYNDCSDLYLALYSEETINHLNSYKAQILFPEKDMPKQGNYEVFTYGTNANSFPVSESATLNPGYYTFYFELDKEALTFRPYNEYIEFDLVAYGDDKHIFTEYAPSNHYSSDDVLEEIYEEQQEYANTPTYYKGIKRGFFIFVSSLALLFLIVTLTTGKRYRSKYFFYKPTTDIEYYRDIPSDLDPKFAADLVFCKGKAPKDDSGVYSAILLSLARKEYIELAELDFNTIQITIKYSPIQEPELVAPQESVFGIDNTSFNQETLMNIPSIAEPVMEEYITDEPVIEKVYEPLSPCEEYYLNMIVRHANGNSITMKTLQDRISSDYEHTDTFVRNIESSTINIGVKDGYFQKADYKQLEKGMRASSKRFLILGIISITIVNFIFYQTRIDFAYGAFFVMGIVCIINSIYLKTQASKYILLSQFGEDEYAKWRGLYNFLNSDTLMHERTYIELPIWEKYLVYATAFDISDKVIDAIQIRCPEASVSTSPVLKNSYCRSKSFRYSGRSFRSAVRHGSSIARSGGGGFGYGGGGRGGGGGGGGH